MTTALDRERALLRDPQVFRIWFVGLLWGVVRWLELLAFGVYAVEVTGSPSLVALLVVLRFLPLALFGVVFGALADVVGPLRMMTRATAAMSLAALGFFLTFRYGAPSYWHVALAAFLSGAFWSTDLPFRRKLIGERVGSKRLSAAMALDGATSNGTRMVGPLIGGALYQVLGIDGVFALGAMLYAIAAATALTIAPTGAPRTGNAGSRLSRAFAGVAEAAGYAARNRDVSRILLVTIAFNVWGFPYLAMVPVIGAAELGLSPAAIGAMSALEGLFALFGALAMMRATSRRWWRPIYFGSVCALIGTILMIGLFPGFWTLAIGLCVGGLCAAGFAAMQSTLIYVAAPPGMEGRFLGLMTICIGAGVIGFANIGLLADQFGGSGALFALGLQGAVPMALIAWRWRELGDSFG